MLHSDRKWHGARWIGAGFSHLPWNAPSRPAPYFRKHWRLEACPSNARVFLAAPGWMELCINGEKVSDEVLQPNPSQFDKIVFYVQYDVTHYLRQGMNTVGVILGNGWYDCSTVTDWHTENAPWQDYPKFLLEILDNEQVLLVSDSSWECLCQDGPITFNELRNGEFYDARKEQVAWCGSEPSGNGWKPAKIVPGPGGFLTAQHGEPCRVMRRFPAELYCDTLDGGVTYALPQNIAGWAEICVQGEAGASVKLIYSENVDPRNRRIDRSNDIARCVKSGEFQTDCYILKGSGIETWHPRFTYHGFQYIRAEVTGRVEILSIDGCAVHTDFKRIGGFSSTSKILNRLYNAVEWSFFSNNVGISTDCPHREKNIWPGDVLSCAQMCMSYFDVRAEFSDWFQSFRANQWNSGLLCALAITPGWGFTWGPGAGDYSMVLLPWLCYLYYGDASMMREYYSAMVSLMDYLEEIAENGILDHGLGDWFCFDGFHAAPKALCGTAAYYRLLETMPKIEKVLQLPGCENWGDKAQAVRCAFQQKWCVGGGHVHQDEATSLALALEYGLCPENERQACAEILHQTVQNNDCKPDYGSIGACTVLRALANNGFVETAYQMLVQPAFPGYVDMLNHGATTLWESWDGKYSRNHTMFCDIGAWMYEYLGGIRLDEMSPGYSAITIAPYCPANLTGVDVWREIGAGRIEVSWKQASGHVDMTVKVPSGLLCIVILPTGQRVIQQETTANYSWSVAKTRDVK